MRCIKEGERECTRKLTFAVEDRDARVEKNEDEEEANEVWEMRAVEREGTPAMSRDPTFEEDVRKR